MAGYVKTYLATHAAKTQVLGIAASSIVLHAKTHARRVKSLGVLVTAPNINPDRREAHDAMLGECLKYAAIGMLEALDRVTRPKYACSSIWALDPERPRFAELRVYKNRKRKSVFHLSRLRLIT